MSGERRRVTLICLLLVALMVAAGWSYRSMAVSARSAAAAAEELAASRAAAETVEALRQRPSVAGSQEMQLTELARLVEAAAGEAKIPLEKVVRVWPEPAHGVGDSPYQEKPTQVLLRGVTLRQLTTFLVTLASGDAGLRVKHVRLTAPRGEADDGTWVAEATVAYLLYSPAEPQRLRVTEKPLDAP